MISKQTLLTTLKHFKQELKDYYKLDKTIVVKDEDGNVNFGETGQILQSNGDGTYSWVNSGSAFGKFYILVHSSKGTKTQSFIYEAGMTWDEFINSNFNAKFIDSNGDECMLVIGKYGVCCSNDMSSYYNYEGDISDVIINGYTYNSITVVEE